LRSLLDCRYGGKRLIDRKELAMIKTPIAGMTRVRFAGFFGTLTA
jgi:hypothetical protein